MNHHGMHRLKLAEAKKRFRAMTNAVLQGKPCSGIAHVWFDGGAVASEKPRIRSLCRMATICPFALLILGIAFTCQCLVAGEIICEGSDYPYHLQGVATDGTNLYWTFTTVLVKTDLQGKLVAKHEPKREGAHMGDLSCRNGKVYVGVGRGRRADGSRIPGEVWEMNAETLAVERTFATPEAIWCNNGLAWWDGSWWVISSSPQGFEYNILVEYDENFVYRETHLVKPNCGG